MIKICRGCGSKFECNAETMHEGLLCSRSKESTCRCPRCWIFQLNKPFISKKDTKRYVSVAHNCFSKAYSDIDLVIDAALHDVMIERVVK